MSFFQLSPICQALSALFAAVWSEVFQLAEWAEIAPVRISHSADPRSLLFTVGLVDDLGRLAIDIPPQLL
jgi:hypothetical protein